MPKNEIDLDVLDATLDRYHALTAHGQEAAPAFCGGPSMAHLETVQRVLEIAAPLIEAAVRERVAAEIEADRASVKRRHGDDPEDVYVRGCLYGSSVAAGIAKNGPRL